MASYDQLSGLNQTDSLRKQVKIAIAVAAVAITAESAATPNHDKRLIWAKQALGSLDSEIDRVLWYVLAANASATVIQITGAADATVQTKVDEAVALFAS